MNHDETIAVVGILVDRLGGDVRITYEEIARARHELTVAPDPLRDDVRLTVDHVTQRGELLAGEIVDDPTAPEAIEPTRIIAEAEPLTMPALCYRCNGSGELLGSLERWHVVETCPTCHGSGYDV